MTRQRGVTVEMLDHDKLVAACKAEGIAAPGYSTNGLLRRLDGGAAVIISSEGVSASAILMGRVYLDTETFEWQSLPLDVAESCRNGETQDLADLIRTFGSRLESNHYAWFQWAHKETR
jgi:hypothetical protein